MGDFYFQQRSGRLRLQELVTIDLEKVILDTDIDLLQKHLENLTFCNLREEDLRYMTDPIVIKLFRISQLMMEYLLHTQARLAGNLGDLARKYNAQKARLIKKRSQVAKFTEESKSLHSLVTQKQKSIATLESLLKEAVSLRSDIVRKNLINFKRSMNEDDEKSKQPSPSREAKTGGSPSKSVGSDVEEERCSFFVVDGARGVCVEVNERKDTPLQTIAQTVCSSLNRTGPIENDLESIRFSYRGRFLPQEGTIGECCIAPNDTLVALFDVKWGQESSGVVDAANISGKREKDTAKVLEEVLTAHKHTLGQISSEMRESFDSAIRTLIEETKCAKNDVSAARSARTTRSNEEDVVVSFKNDAFGVDYDGYIDDNIPRRRHTSRALRDRKDKPGNVMLLRRSKIATRDRSLSCGNNLTASSHITNHCSRVWNGGSEAPSLANSNQTMRDLIQGAKSPV